jgi:GT2 family glycosyltransferase
MIVCNVDRFLAESIESILRQTFRDFEFIIVDYGSTDNSKAIASRFAREDSRIKIHAIPHCGLAEARNQACFLAQSRYIALMDADDSSLPHRLASQFEFMEMHPEVGLLGGAAEWIDAAGRFLCLESNPSEDHEIRLTLGVRNPFHQSGVILRKDVFVSLGGYRRVFAQVEDYDLWLRVAERSAIANLEQVVAKRRIHSNQLSIRAQTQQALCLLAAQAAALARSNRHPDPLDSVSEITPAVLGELGITDARLQNAIVSGGRQWIRHMCMAGEYSVALEAAMNLLRSNWPLVERWQIADLHLTVARLHWRQRRLRNSLAALARAVRTRPIILGYPLMPILRRFGFVGVRKSV